MRYRILPNEFGQWKAQRLAGCWPFREWEDIGWGQSREHVLTMVEAHKIDERRRKKCEDDAEEV